MKALCYNTLRLGASKPGNSRWWHVERSNVLLCVRFSADGTRLTNLGAQGEVHVSPDAESLENAKYYPILHEVDKSGIQCATQELVILGRTLY